MKRLVKELKEAEKFISRQQMPADWERRIAQRLSRKRPAARGDKPVEENGERAGR